VTPEPCPECKGRCCRDHYGYRIAHMDTDAEFCEHTCDACNDGTKYTAPRTAEEERADVVAYLRQRIEMEQLQVLGQTSKWVEAIERGEHVGWSKDDTSRKAMLDREHYRP